MAKSRLSLCLILLMLSALPVLGQVAKQQGNDLLSSLVFVDDSLRLPDESDSLDNLRSVVNPALQNSWDAFRIGVGPTATWTATIDKRTGLVTFAEGGNVAWIPGRGNQMTAQDLAGVLNGKPLNLSAMDAIARAYMPRIQSLLGIDPSTPRPQSGPVGSAGRPSLVRGLRRRSAGNADRGRPRRLPRQQRQPDPVRLGVPAVAERQGAPRPSSPATRP